MLSLDKSKCGLHSLCSGGASAARFKRCDRWRSENAKEGYVKEGDRLQVRHNLGL